MALPVLATSEVQSPGCGSDTNGLHNYQNRRDKSADRPQPESHLQRRHLSDGLGLDGPVSKSKTVSFIAPCSSGARRDVSAITAPIIRYLARNLWGAPLHSMTSRLVLAAGDEPAYICRLGPVAWPTDLAFPARTDNLVIQPNKSVNGYRVREWGQLGVLQCMQVEPPCSFLKTEKHNPAVTLERR